MPSCCWGFVLRLLLLFIDERQLIAKLPKKTRWVL